MHPTLKRAAAWGLRSGFTALDRATASSRVRHRLDRSSRYLLAALAQLGLTDKARAHVRGWLKQAETYGLVVPKLLSVSPHNIKLYEYFIRRHLADGVVFITSANLYGDKPLDRSKAHILLRHDVDYTPENLHLFTDIELRLGVRSDIYVILDGAHYDIRPYAEPYAKLADAGFCLGLHTLAPVDDDFYTTMRREIDTFTSVFGLPPRYFTIHGPPSPPERPPNWAEVRENFIAKIQPRQTSFGFLGSHNFSGIDAWLEDSGVGGEFAYLSMDWIERKAEKGRVLGILAHPDHWTEWRPRWRVDPNSVKEHPAIHDFIYGSPSPR